MKFTASLLGAMLGASSILALPLDQPGSQPTQLTPSSRRSSPNTSLKTLSGYGPGNASPPAVYYDKNWAGAVQTGAGYKSVTGTITVPPVKLPPGANPEVLHAVSAWVGIDGELACQDTILQAGVDMYMNHSIPEYWAWYVPTVIPPPSTSRFQPLLMNPKS